MATSATLQVVIQRKQRRAPFHLVALTNRQRLDPSGLVGSDEDHVGLDPALEDRLFVIVTSSQHERGTKYRGEGEATADHVALPSPNSRSRWARINSATSSGAKRSNNPFHTTAINAGATSN